MRPAPVQQDYVFALPPGPSFCPLTNTFSWCDSSFPPERGGLYLAVVSTPAKITSPLFGAN
jgi:hypothetical protein